MRRATALLLPLAIVGLAFADVGFVFRRAVAMRHGYWLLSDVVPLQHTRDACGQFCLMEMARLAGRSDAAARIGAAPVPAGGYSTAELQALAQSLGLPTHIVAFRDSAELGASPMLLMLPARRHFIVYEGPKPFGFCTIYDPVAGRLLAPRAWVAHQTALFAVALEGPSRSAMEADGRDVGRSGTNDFRKEVKR